ncbi:MAG: hypothetical protein ACREI3_03940 [Nitrospirales bacterium]
MHGPVANRACAGATRVCRRAATTAPDVVCGLTAAPRAFYTAARQHAELDDV